MSTSQCNHTAVCPQVLIAFDLPGSAAGCDVYTFCIGRCPISVGLTFRGEYNASNHRPDGCSRQQDKLVHSSKPYHMKEGIVSKYPSHFLLQHRSKGPNPHARQSEKPGAAISHMGLSHLRQIGREARSFDLGLRRAVRSENVKAHTFAPALWLRTTFEDAETCTDGVSHLIA